MRQSVLAFGSQQAGPSMSLVAQPTRSSSKRSHSVIEEADSKGKTTSQGVLLAGTARAAPPTAIPESARLWTDIARPLCAADVLGNEEQASYLRDWLKALQIVSRQHSDKEKASVKGKQVASREQVFSIGQTAEEEAWFDQFRKRDIEAGKRRGSLNGSSLAAAITVDDSSTRALALSNAIILCGPSGSGKTASVYACANELGFEVFELYPGMGRRAGKDVQNAVGDLGKNHMVSSGGTGGGAFRAAASASAADTLAPKTCVARPVTSFFKSSASKEENGTVHRGPTSKNQPRQSLILLEEADILYGDDKGFWSAVTDLIGDSRRPIVLTCQDTSAIPMQDLAIQRVLSFEAPAPEIAAPYLVGLAARQEYTISVRDAVELYCDTRGRAEIQQDFHQLLQQSTGPLHPEKYIDTGFDLRQSILQLQFESRHAERLLSRDDAAPDADDIELPSLQRLVSQSERRSYADSYMRMPLDRAIEMLEPDQYTLSNDDLQSLPSAALLLKPLPSSDSVALPMYGREDAFYAAICDHIANVTLDVAFDATRLAISQDIHEILQALLVPPMSNVPQSEAVLDYAPLIRNIIAADDAEESAHEARIQAAIYEAQEGAKGENETQDIKSSSAYLRASASLAKLGIRPSRHATKMLLQRGSDGLMELTRRETDFSRYLLLDSSLLQVARSSGLNLDDFS